jgi:U1 small nuclear ribonucleoprotein C
MSLMDICVTEIGHEKAQSVIDSITSSYAAEGQANPMLLQHGAPPPGAFPPPFGFPGVFARYHYPTFEKREEKKGAILTNRN